MEVLREPVEEFCSEDIFDSVVLLLDTSVGSRVMKHATVEKKLTNIFVSSSPALLRLLGPAKQSPIHNTIPSKLPQGEQRRPSERRHQGCPR